MLKLFPEKYSSYRSAFLCSFAYASVDRLGAAFIPRCFTLPLQHKSPFVISLSESALARWEKIIATSWAFDVNPFAFLSFPCFITSCSKLTVDNDISCSIWLNRLAHFIFVLLPCFIWKFLEFSTKWYPNSRDFTFSFSYLGHVCCFCNYNSS